MIHSYPAKLCPATVFSLLTSLARRRNAHRGGVADLSFSPSFQPTIGRRIVDQRQQQTGNATSVLSPVSLERHGRQERGDTLGSSVSWWMRRAQIGRCPVVVLQSRSSGTLHLGPGRPSPRAGPRSHAYSGARTGANKQRPPQARPEFDMVHPLAAAGDPTQNASCHNPLSYESKIHCIPRRLPRTHRRPVGGKHLP